MNASRHFLFPSPIPSWRLLLLATLVSTTVTAQTGGGPMSDPALGQADEAAARAASRTEAFKRLDENGDGAISKLEATGPLAAQFNELDANLNGSLDYAEFIAVQPVKP